MFLLPVQMLVMTSPNAGFKNKLQRSIKFSRVIIESTFGFLKTRFCCLNKSDETCFLGTFYAANLTFSGDKTYFSERTKLMKQNKLMKYMN